MLGPLAFGKNVTHAAVLLIVYNSEILNHLGNKHLGAGGGGGKTEQKEA